MIDLKQIAEATGSEFKGLNSVFEDAEFSIDSRTVNSPSSSVFFAIRTPHNDGHKYIHDLYLRGVRAFVVNADFGTATYPEAGFIVSENVVNVLQKAASLHRQKYVYPVIGITGSNGKTMVKEWLLQTLEEPASICSNPKSYNSQLGVPLSVMQMKEKHHLGIFEAGISMTGEMEKLEAIIRPDIGVLTHLGPAHNEGFGSHEQKIQEKLLLFRHCQVVMLRYQPEILSQIHCPVLTFDINENTAADLRLKTSRNGRNTLFKGTFHEQSIEFSIPYTDEASIENAALCCLVNLYFKQFNPDKFENLISLGMRMELKKGRNNTLLINDSYSNDLHSLASSLNFLENQSIHPGKTVILSDIEGSGLPADVLYQRVKTLLDGKKINRLIGIGPEISERSKLFAEPGIHTEFYQNTKTFIEKSSEWSFKDENILLKGARRFKFEDIAKKLEQTVHGTILEINLTAALNNLRFFREKLPKGTKIMAMVKAFAYGSGSFEMAKQIENKVDYLAVAYTDEGISLRNAGIIKPIMVMNPEDDSFFQLSPHNLEPVIFSLAQFKRFASYHKESNQGLTGQPLKVHLELDSGMHRLGFMPDDLTELEDLMRQHPELETVSVFSHLSASDEQQHDAFTMKQFAIFKQFAENIETFIGKKIIRHISNTAGILRFSQDTFNMVRLGIGLYGIDPTGEFRNKLEPVFTLKTTISQIKNISANESIGYSRKSISDHSRRIAILALGYADGLNRLLSNGKGSFLINGKEALVTGNICMDMCMVDVSDIECNEGDEAILFGANKSIYQLAESLGTIPYEVLTSISQRVKRVYVSE